MKCQVSETMSGKLLATKATNHPANWGLPFVYLYNLSKQESCMTSYTLDKTVRKKVGGILLNNYLNKLPGLRFVHTQKKHQ